MSRPQEARCSSKPCATVGALHCKSHGPKIFEGSSKPSRSCHAYSDVRSTTACFGAPAKRSDQHLELIPQTIIDRHRRVFDHARSARLMMRICFGLAACWRGKNLLFYLTSWLRWTSSRWRYNAIVTRKTCRVWVCVQTFGT